MENPVTVYLLPTAHAGVIESLTGEASPRRILLVADEARLEREVRVAFPSAEIRTRATSDATFVPDLVVRLLGDAPVANARAARRVAPFAGWF